MSPETLVFDTMNDVDTGTDNEKLTPADAFSVVANDIRVEILCALAAAERRAEARSTVSFSDLFHAVDVRDSGLFNYHLETLLGHFLKKSESGYELTYAGRKVVRIVMEGAFSERIVEPFEVDGTCHECHGPLSASYENGRMAVECLGCGQFGIYGAFPPGGVEDRTPTEIADAFDTHVRAKLELIVEGICPECRGSIHSRILPGTPDHWSYDGFDMIAHHRCERCEYQLWPAVSLHLIAHPDVRSFFFEHEKDPRETHLWNYRWAVTHQLAEIHSNDPWEVEVQIPVADDELRVTLDGNLDVRKTVGSSSQ